jgi:translation elongation factor EF-Ts
VRVERLPDDQAGTAPRDPPSIILDHTPVEDHLKEVVAKLGERVCIKRFLRFEVSQQS